MELLTKPTRVDLAAADASSVLVLAPAAEAVPRLVVLLSRGCFVRCTTGMSLRGLLLDQFRISPVYLEREIKIVFLDSSPVDDLDAAIVRDGARIALSAAMPGLAGAAMRRDGLGWVRASITHHETSADRPVAEGVMLLKLFNQVMEELGPGFLSRGVYVQGPMLADFLQGLDARFWQRCPIGFNGVALGPEALAERLSGDPAWLRLTMHLEASNPEAYPWR